MTGPRVSQRIEDTQPPFAQITGSHLTGRNTPHRAVTHAATLSPRIVNLTRLVELGNRRAFSPLWTVQGYLWGTVVLFVLGPLMQRVTNPLTLLSYVSLAHLAVLAGYRVGIQRRFGKHHSLKPRVVFSDLALSILLAAGALHLALSALWNIYSVQTGGASSLVEALQNPGEAYLRRNLVLDRGVQSVGLLFQVLNLSSALSMTVVPLLVVHWKRLSALVRWPAILAVIGDGIYYLLIGTQKGIGDIVIVAGASLLVKSYDFASTTAAKPRIAREVRLLVVMLVTCALFLGYMASNSVSRTDAFGSGESELVAEAPSPVLAAIFGDRLGYGLEVALAYPSHGYYGLSCNLDTPFQWTYGFGAIRALNDYKLQYVGGEDQLYNTYPARTEMRTGWSWGTYWSTIYPWLASDLTYPGAVVFMGWIGFLFARFWIESILDSNVLSLVLFTQLSILFVYVPANFQLGISKMSLLGVIVLSACYVGVNWFGRRQIVRRVITESCG